MKNNVALFDDYKISRLYDEETETWFFSVVDIIQVLTQQPDYQVARKYWNKLKERLKKEGSESVTNCHRLKLKATDGEGISLILPMWKLYFEKFSDRQKRGKWRELFASKNRLRIGQDMI